MTDSKIKQFIEQVAKAIGRKPPKIKVIRMTDDFHKAKWLTEDQQKSYRTNEKSGCIEGWYQLFIPHAFYNISTKTIYLKRDWIYEETTASIKAMILHEMGHHYTDCRFTKIRSEDYVSDRDFINSQREYMATRWAIMTASNLKMYAVRNKSKETTMWEFENGWKGGPHRTAAEWTKEDGLI